MSTQHRGQSSNHTNKSTQTRAVAHTRGAIVWIPLSARTRASRLAGREQARKHPQLPFERECLHTADRSPQRSCLQHATPPSAEEVLFLMAATWRRSPDFTEDTSTEPRQGYTMALSPIPSVGRAGGRKSLLAAGRTASTRLPG